MSEELFDKPISLYEFLNLSDGEQHRIAERARQLTGIYTVDLARAWQLPAKELEKFSRKMPNNGFLYVQIDDVWKIRRELFPERTMPGLTYSECALLFNVSVEQVKKTPCWLGITVWPSPSDNSSDHTVPSRDVLHAYHYYWASIRKQFPLQ